MEGYQLVRSDWLWYTLLPLVSYTALIVAAILLPSHPALALFIIAAVPVLLLFIGIRNAWDVVTYMAIERASASRTVSPPDISEATNAWPQTRRACPIGWCRCFLVHLA